MSFKSLLEENGYTSIPLPKTNIQPFMLLEKVEENLFRRIARSLLGKNEDAELLNAEVPDLFPSKKGTKPSKRTRNVAFFKGQDIFSTDNGIDLKSLESLGIIASAEAKAKFKKGGTLLYDFHEPQEKYLDNEILVEQWLNFAKPIKGTSFSEKLKEGKLFIVMATLQTTKFSIKSASDFLFDSSLKADLLEGKIGKAAGKTTTDSNQNDSVSYVGDKPIVFALKASKIIYHKETDSYSLSRKTLETVRSSSSIESENIEANSIELL
jgi:hypothetical protein